MIQQELIGWNWSRAIPHHHRDNVALRSLRISSSVFPENIEPQITSMQPRRLEECKVFSRNMRKTDLNLFIFTRRFISQNYVKDIRFITFEI